MNIIHKKAILSPILIIHKIGPKVSYFYEKFKIFIEEKFATSPPKNNENALKIVKNLESHFLF